MQADLRHCGRPRGSGPGPESEPGCEGAGEAAAGPRPWSLQTPERCCRGGAFPLRASRALSCGSGRLGDSMSSTKPPRRHGAGSRPSSQGPTGVGTAWPKWLQSCPGTHCRHQQRGLRGSDETFSPCCRPAGARGGGQVTVPTAALVDTTDQRPLLERAARWGRQARNPGQTSTQVPTAGARQGAESDGGGASWAAAPGPDPWAVQRPSAPFTLPSYAHGSLAQAGRA